MTLELCAFQGYISIYQTARALAIIINKTHDMKSVGSKLGKGNLGNFNLNLKSLKNGTKKRNPTI